MGEEVMAQCELEETAIGTNCKTHDVIFGIFESQCPYARVAELKAEKKLIQNERLTDVNALNERITELEIQATDYKQSMEYWEKEYRTLREQCDAMKQTIKDVNQNQKAVWNAAKAVVAERYALEPDHAVMDALAELVKTE